MSFRPVMGDSDGGFGVPDQRPYASGSTFIQGALLIANTSGEWAECGADPASVHAVALHPVGTGSGAEYPIGYKEFPPLQAIAIPIRRQAKFTAKYTGTLGTAGVNYGVAKLSNGEWVVDFGDTTNDVVQLVRSLAAAPIGQGLVEVIFLDSVIVVD